jgi:phosphoserine phosphatase
MPYIIVHKSILSDSLVDHLQQLGAGQARCHGDYCSLSSPQPVNIDALDALSEQFQVDINLFPQSHRAGPGDVHSIDLQKIALLITDMDSTLINIECVDEIADFAGKKAEVSAITEAAMRGELDFNASLSRRVAVLKGLSVNVLDEVYRHRLTLNPGAETLIQGLQHQRIKTALVSGGFTYFTDKLRQRLGFDFVLSNVLGLENEELTGEVKGEIVNAERKAQFLQDICNQMNIDTRQAVAVGDGANDLKMMYLAGMSVAYRAKPAVRQQADFKINHSGLDSILHILDFAKQCETM